MSANETSQRQKLIKEGVPVLEGAFWLHITPDRLEAYLKPPTQNPPLLTPEEKILLRKELEKWGLVRILDTPKHQRDRIVVAEGTPPKAGQDASIRPLVAVSNSMPLSEERIDYRERNAIVCVQKGQRIAEKIPPTPGTPGMDVFGDVIPPVPGKDTSFKFGQGVKLSADGLYLEAEQDGVLLYENGRYSIKPSFVLNGNVDWDIGNIRFYGKKLTINGDVKRGFKIWCKGDLEINGSVEDEVTIEVQGDLHVGGLIKSEKTFIKSSGNACLSIVEYAHIIIGQHLCVSDYLLNTHCEVGGSLRMAHEAKIVGGKYYVKGSIVVGSLGSSAHVKTVVRAGYDQSLHNTLEELQIKLSLAYENFDKIGKILRTEKELREKGLLDAKREAIFKRLKLHYRKLLLDITTLEEEQKALKRRLGLLREATVKAFEIVYPGTEIWITNRHFLVSRPLKDITFYCKGRQIVYRQNG